MVSPVHGTKEMLQAAGWSGAGAITTTRGPGGSSSSIARGRGAVGVRCDECVGLLFVSCCVCASVATASGVDSAALCLSRGAR